MAKNKNIYGIAGLTSRVEGDGDGKIENLNEVLNFLDGFSDKVKLKDILEAIVAGGGGEVLPDSIGSEEIKDHSIEMEDISEEVFADDSDIEALFDNN